MKDFGKGNTNTPLLISSNLIPFKEISFIIKLLVFFTENS